jgi:hypothetical protein
MFVESFFFNFFLVIDYHLTTCCLALCRVTFHSSLTVQSYTRRLNILTNSKTVLGVYLVLKIRHIADWSDCEFETCSWESVFCTTLCDKVCQCLATGWWFSLGTPVSSTNKMYSHDIPEILLKVALNTTTLFPNPLIGRLKI